MREIRQEEESGDKEDEQQEWNYFVGFNADHASNDTSAIAQKFNASNRKLLPQAYSIEKEDSISDIIRNYYCYILTMSDFNCILWISISKFDGVSNYV